MRDGPESDTEAAKEGGGGGEKSGGIHLHASCTVRMFIIKLSHTQVGHTYNTQSMQDLYICV